MYFAAFSLGFGLDYSGCLNVCVLFSYVVPRAALLVTTHRLLFIYHDGLPPGENSDTNWAFTRYDRRTDRSVRRSYRVNAQ